MIFQTTRRLNAHQKIYETLQKYKISRKKPLCKQSGFKKTKTNQLRMRGQNQLVSVLNN